MKKRVLIGCSLLMALMLIPFVTAQAAELKVGAGWPGSPYLTIQAAIDAAAPTGDEIWVEKGTYTLASTITVGKSVSIYGGFDCAETLRAERDPAANVTIVDGNNSVGCFLVTSTVTIDGFTITKGYNDALLTNGGGAIANGIDAGAAGYLTAANCIFILNNSAKHDGAINNDNGDITITNCTFSNNTAVNRGGAVGNNYGDNMTITNCTFSENSAGSAGAVYIRVDSVNNTITDCTFSKNSATSASGDGGAIIGDQNVSITRCIFDQNTTGRMGTFATRGDKTAVFTNCIFSKNQVLQGGAIGVNGTGSIGTLKVINCTIADNTLKTGGKGGAIYTTAAGGTGIFTVTNSILWANGGNQIDRSGTTQLLPTVTYTDIAQTGYAPSNGNINTDPLFVGSSDYHLQINPPCIIISPCIDAGTSSGAPSNDLEKTTRPQISGYDMGAYEMPCPTLIDLASFTATPSNGKVLLEWSTASELDNAGFNIYRAGADGAYAKINAEIIPAQGNSANGADYQFVDNNVQNRQTYSYQLEDVDLSGAVTTHGPVQATPRFIYLFK